MNEEPTETSIQAQHCDWDALSITAVLEKFWTDHGTVDGENTAVVCIKF